METNHTSRPTDCGRPRTIPCMECLRLINSAGEAADAHAALAPGERNHVAGRVALYKCSACGANLLQGRNGAKTSWAYFL